MAYAVVRTDNLTGITDGARLATAKYYVSSTATGIDNGNIVKLDSYLEGAPERETWKAVAPAAGDYVGKCNGRLGLVATPEIVYSYKKYYNLDEFTNAAGAPLRVYVLEPGDEFSVTAEAFAADAAPGTTSVTKKYITLTASSTKMTAVADAPNDGESSPSAVPYFAECIKVEKVGEKTFFVLRVQ